MNLPTLYSLVSVSQRCVPRTTVYALRRSVDQLNHLSPGLWGSRGRRGGLAIGRPKWINIILIKNAVVSFGQPTSLSSGRKKLAMGNLEGSDYKIAKQQHYDKTTNYNNLFNYLKSNIKSCTEETSEILFFLPHWDLSCSPDCIITGSHMKKSWRGQWRPIHLQLLYKYLWHGHFHHLPILRTCCEVSQNSAMKYSSGNTSPFLFTMVIPPEPSLTFRSVFFPLFALSNSCW